MNCPKLLYRAQLPSDLLLGSTPILNAPPNNHYTKSLSISFAKRFSGLANDRERHGARLALCSQCSIPKHSTMRAFFCLQYNTYIVDHPKSLNRSRRAVLTQCTFPKHYTEQSLPSDLNVPPQSFTWSVPSNLRILSQTICTELSLSLTSIQRRGTATPSH